MNHMNDDAELLRRYAESGEEAAFAALVQRHLNLVYSAALRQLNGDAHLAADVAQLVFTDLARKARELTGHRVLAGWLFTSTRFAAAKVVRGEQRRHVREQEAHLMQELSQNDADAQLDWQRVRPVLDEALGELKEDDREAILLRFFQGSDYATVGARLHLAENTARMRVERALDKLRSRLESRGVTSTAAVLAAALGHQAVVAAPAGLATTITGAALSGAGAVSGAVVAGTAAASGAVAAGAAAGGGSTFASFMSMTKLQMGLSGALAVAGATGFVLQANSNTQLRDEIAQIRQDNATVSALPAENLRLARAAAEAADMRRDDAEFARLQQEATGLRTKLRQVAKVEENRAASGERGAMAVFDIAQLDRAPVPRFQARPQYPADLRKAGISGEVVVDFIVDKEGGVRNAYALRSTHPGFENAAIESVSQWKFKPGAKGGKDVNTHMQVPIVFTLNNR